jgi:hypothetical protein
MGNWGIALAAVMAATPAAAQTYGDTLLTAIAARHPGVASIRVATTAKDGRPIGIRRGEAAAVVTTVPLTTAMGDPIGVLTVTGRRRIAAGPIARDLARRIYVADNLIEADPFVAGAIRDPRAQALVDQMLDRFPDLITLALHVAPLGASNTIIASSFGRIGKPADADDADVIARGTIRREVTNAGRRLAVELPLLDASGRVIGALSTSFLIEPRGGNEAAYTRALAVRAALARRIPSLAAL